MKVRPYKTKDKKTILKMEQAYLDSPWSEAVLLDTLKNPDTVMLVAEDDGTAVGYGSFSKITDEAHINNICVDISFRQNGTGGTILKELEIIAAKRGCNKMLLEVAAGNAGAIRLYEKYGFTKLYVRPKYYNGIKDAVVMRKQI